MVLRLKPTPTRFPPKILYIPLDNTSLHSILRENIKKGNLEPRFYLPHALEVRLHAHEVGAVAITLETVALISAG